MESALLAFLLLLGPAQGFLAPGASSSSGAMLLSRTGGRVLAPGAVASAATARGALLRGTGAAGGVLNGAQRRRPWMSTTEAAAAASTAAARYDHASIEPKWRKYWSDNKTFKTPERNHSKPKKYVLDMFPYPSGSGLHVGHPEGYTASDVMARFWRMNGYDVLHPMGWDSFGLPAEQHAIQTGTHPAVTTYENIAVFKRQLQELGFSYDWERELATTDVGFVKWTQWIFLQLFKAGLAQQSEALVNWCPALGTVLANEEVINGLSERGNHPVVRQPLRQWVLKITEYADKLEAGLEGLHWPEGTLTAQRQWIGRSEGASITFALADADAARAPAGSNVEVFTTRPDTLMGVTYVVLAPEHPLVAALAAQEQRAAVEEYVAAAAGKSDLDRTAAAGAKAKTGVPLGASVVHPLTGEFVPIWVADYVLGGYGTGAVMAVPGHDERDMAFAQAFGLPVKRVVAAAAAEAGEPLEEAFTAEGVSVNSGDFSGLSTEACKAAVVEALAQRGAGAAVVNYKLRDWIFSRQRYWGEPIPIYFPVDLPEGGDPRKGVPHTIRYDQPLPVPEEELPLTLPEMESFEPGDDPAGCLARATDWRYFQRDGKWFARETNTMPQWAGSCWYYLRFTDPDNAGAAWGSQADQDWLPVDLYVGGQEHAVLHLLYARFWHRVLHDLGYAKDPEPFARLVHQGMILGADGEKMSKSRGNVVNPDDVVSDVGADALRLYEMFMGPLEATKPWQTSQVAGVVRFRDRVYALCQRELAGGPPADRETLSLLHRTMRKVTKDIEELAFNTAIAALMVLSNHLAAQPQPSREAVEALVLMLSPFAPHVGEECWSLLGHGQSLAYAPWVGWDEALCLQDTARMGVQVNGKVKAELELAVDASEADARAAALALDKVCALAEGREVKKFIYVPGRIINLVLGGPIKK